MVFDRFKERMRQGTGLSKDMGNFKGTDNSRIETMLSEADDFASRLKSYKKHLKEHNASTKSLLESTHKVLSADLPKTYDRDVQGNVSGQFTANNSHNSVNVNSISDLTSRHAAELQTQVFAPIDQWLETHKAFSSKTTKLNNFRLDLDNARRSHNRSDLQRVRQQQKSDTVEPTLVGKIQEQSTDLQGKRDAWTQYESEVHAELANLVNEAANMHVHIARALHIEADICSSAVVGQGIGGHGAPHASGGGGGYGGGGGAPLQQPLHSGGGAYGGSSNLAQPEYVQMST